MKTRILALTLLAALLAGGFTATRALAANTTASAPAHGRFLLRLADKLKLTTDQRSQIKTVRAGEKDTLAPLLAGVHEARKDLRAAIRAGDANETAVRAAAAEADLAVERMKLYGKIAPILTEAQRAQLADLQQRADHFVDRALGRRGAGLDN